MEIFALLSLLLQFLMGFLPFIIFAIFIASVKKVFKNPQKKTEQAPPTKAKVAPRNIQGTQNKRPAKTGQRNTWANQARNMSELLKEELLKTEPWTPQPSVKTVQAHKTPAPLVQKTNRASQASASMVTSTPKVEKKEAPVAPTMVPQTQVIDSDHLVQAMIYKEILDKPLALRD